MDEFLRRQDDIIDSVGWMVMHVVPTRDDPVTDVPFAYTVGLTACDHPEIFVAGLPPETAHSLLNDLAGRVHSRGERFTHGQRVTDLLVSHDTAIVDARPSGDLVPAAAYRRYGPERVRLQQLVWPDPANRLPWEVGHVEGPTDQPLLGWP